jgi:hypothetical protein
LPDANLFRTASLSFSAPVGVVFGLLVGSVRSIVRVQSRRKSPRLGFTVDLNADRTDSVQMLLE